MATSKCTRFVVIVICFLFFFFKLSLVAHLGPREVLRRQHGANTSDAITLMHNYRYSFLEGFMVSPSDLEDLATRLRVELSILTYNVDRLRSHCHIFGLLHESYRKTILEDSRHVVLRTGPLNSQQMALALEFYLQIDGKSISDPSQGYTSIFFLSRCLLHENLFVSWSTTTTELRRSFLWKK